MKAELDNFIPFRTFLYRRGFIITTDFNIETNDYPFYNNWEKRVISKGYYLYLHKDNYFYSKVNNGVIHFIVGHAYDPYNNLANEDDILVHLGDALSKSLDDYWKEEGNLTGVFCIGFIKNDLLTYAVDCCGMQIVYYCVSNGNLYLTSHSKLIADLLGFEQDPYIKRLVNRKLFKYWGRWLPGDLSPYKELKRTQPNFYMKYHRQKKKFAFRRFYPIDAISEVTSDEEYFNLIHELGSIIHSSLELMLKKWPDKKIAISVTGGHDSKTTLSCANGLYDQFMFFSYISNDGLGVESRSSNTRLLPVYL